MPWLSALFMFGCASRPLAGPHADAGAPGDLASSGSSDLARSSLDMARPFGDFAMPPDLALAPDLAGPAAQCLTGGNVIYLDGDPGDYIHPGSETIQVSSWSTDSFNSPPVTFAYAWDGVGASWWTFYFSTEELGGSLVPGVYPNTERFPFETAGHPGMDISGSGRGCNTSTGTFQILSSAFGPTDGNFTEFTATFEQHCEGAATALRGCIHFEAP